MRTGSRTRLGPRESLTGQWEVTASAGSRQHPPQARMARGWGPPGGALPGKGSVGGGGRVRGVVVAGVSSHAPSGSTSGWEGTVTSSGRTIPGGFMGQGCAEHGTGLDPVRGICGIHLPPGPSGGAGQWWGGAGS